MLELVFLGTGSGIPTKNRNHSAIWLAYGEDVWLWDCGEGTQRQMLLAKLNFMRIDRIFITHWHADHWAGLIGLIQTMNLEKRTRPLFIYGPEAERFVADILDMEYWGPRFRIIAKDVPADGEPCCIYKHKDYDIYTCPTLHTVPSVAYCFQEKERWNVDIKKAERLYGLRQGPLVGKLKEEGKIVFKGKEIRLEDVAILKKGLKVVYTGDTKPFDKLIDFVRGADILIHDATFLEEREDRMHAGAKDAARIAKAAEVRRLVLTHFSRRYQDTRPLLDEAKKIFPNTMVAEDFMRIKLKD